MKYVVAFSLISLLLAVQAFWSDFLPLRVALAWGCASFLVVGLAYAGLGPRVFGKRGDGCLPWWAHVLFAPYLVLGHGTRWMYRFVVRERRWDEVAPGLLVGARPFGDDLAELADHGPLFVLDVTCEFPELALLAGGGARGAYLCLPMLDATAPTQDQLRTGVAWCAQHMARGTRPAADAEPSAASTAAAGAGAGTGTATGAEAGTQAGAELGAEAGAATELGAEEGSESGTVFVHCANGHGRSVTFVVALLVFLGRSASVEEAESTVRVARPRARMTHDQRAAAEQFVRELSSPTRSRSSPDATARARS